MASYGLVQVRWERARPAGQPAEDVIVNTFHCQVTDGGWTTDDRDTFNTQFDSLLTPLYTFISSNVTNSERRFYNVPAVRGPSGDPVFTTLPGFGGTGAHAAELPPQCALSITWETSARRHWGRIYWGGLINSLIADGRVTSANLSTWGTAIDAFGTALRQGGQGLVVWDRAAWAPHDVTTFRIDDVMDVQRRRRFSQAYNRHLGSFVA